MESAEAIRASLGTNEARATIADRWITRGRHQRPS